MLRTLAILGSAATLVTSSACGGDDGGSPGSAPVYRQPATTAPAGKVTMQGTAFSPKAISVKVGESVTWTNQDSVAHNATATEGATFKSDDFGKGGTYTWKAGAAGSVKYVCTLHPGMEGTIRVTG